MVKELANPERIQSGTLDFSFVVLFLLPLLLLIFNLFFHYQIWKNTISNTLQMIGIWLLFVFIIPATIQQWISIEKPTNLMIDIIDTKRDKTDEIYDQ